MSEPDYLNNHGADCQCYDCTICAIRAMTVRLEAALGKIEATMKAGFEREAQRYTEVRAKPFGLNVTTGDALQGNAGLTLAECAADPSFVPCGVEQDRWICTERKGHKGDHIALGVSDQEFGRWPNTDPHNSPDAGKEE